MPKTKDTPGAAAKLAEFAEIAKTIAAAAVDLSSARKTKNVTAIKLAVEKHARAERAVGVLLRALARKTGRAQLLPGLSESQAAGWKRQSKLSSEAFEERLSKTIRTALGLRTKEYVPKAAELEPAAKVSNWSISADGTRTRTVTSGAT
jgi:hypothetical protein